MNQEASSRPIATSGPAPLLDLEPTDVRIRPISTLTEFRACVDLQAEVWGPEYTDSVPASLLQVATYVGGVGPRRLHAQRGDDRLSLRPRRASTAARSCTGRTSSACAIQRATSGVGRLLKEAQRAELAKRGVKRMSWTFDPLVAKNAHLNINRLGAKVVDYAQNMYGTTTAPCTTASRPIASSSPCNARRRTARDTAELAQTRHPVLTPAIRSGDVPLDSTAPRSAFWIEIPSDIKQVIEQAPRARHCVARGGASPFPVGAGARLHVTALQRDPVATRSFYLLQREASV